MTRLVARISLVAFAFVGFGLVVSFQLAYAQGGDLDCVDYSSGSDAQDASSGGDPNYLDADGDGQACEWTGPQKSNWMFGGFVGCVLGIALGMSARGGTATSSELFAAILISIPMLFLASFLETPAHAILPPRTPNIALFVIGAVAMGVIGFGVGMLFRLRFNDRHGGSKSNDKSTLATGMGD